MRTLISLCYAFSGATVAGSSPFHCCILIRLMVKTSTVTNTTRRCWISTFVLLCDLVVLITCTCHVEIILVTFTINSHGMNLKSALEIVLHDQFHYNHHYCLYIRSNRKGNCRHSFSYKDSFEGRFDILRSSQRHSQYHSPRSLQHTPQI